MNYRYRWMAAAIAATVLTAPAQAQSLQAHNFDLPAQPLGAAIRALAAQSGDDILAPSELLARLVAPALRDTLSTETALRRVLAGTGLTVRRVGRAFIVVADPASPARPQPPSDASDLVITGTRIRGAAPTGSPVIVLDRQAIERSGYATTQQLVQSLPQNYGGGANEGTVTFSTRNNAASNTGLGSSANLRGLGTTSTLTLIDGSRVALGGVAGTFVDLTLIPSSAIDRIEVLADGASALYGSDAVAGVVNLRLRDRFSGAESRVRYGGAKGFDEWQASQLVGFGWGSGHLTAAYEFYRRGNLAAADRAFATEDLRRFGGPDYRGNFANPGTIIAADGSAFGIPAGQDGRSLTAAMLLPGGNLADGRANTDILPRLTRHSGIVSLSQSITSWLRLRATGTYADRRSRSRTLPDNIGGVVVTSANPFYVDPLGTGEPITVNYSFERDLGIETGTAHVVAKSVFGTLEADLGRWAGSVSGSFSDQQDHSRTLNIPNYYYLEAALADPNPATAYNLFGDGSFTSTATIERVRGSFKQTGNSRIWSAGGKLDGTLVALPAGTIRLAIGGEYRHERYGSTATDFEFTPEPVDAGSSGFPIARSITAGYAELLIPLIAPTQQLALTQALDVSLAARIEHYSDFGDTTNPKVGIRWRPISAFTLRGSYGTSFRAPTFLDIRTGRGSALFIPLPLADPASPTGTANALALFGASPDIGPEKAKTWTLGLDLTPPALPGLIFALTYFDIDYRDRIATLGAEYQRFLTDRRLYGELITDHPDAATINAYYGDQNFSNPFGIAASDIAVIVDGRSRNLATTTVRGLDFDLGYRGAARQLTFEAGVSGSYLFTYDRQISKGASPVDVVSSIGNPVDFRARARLIAQRGPWSTAAFVNYLDGYVNNGVLLPERVSSYATFDLQLGYDLSRLATWARGTRLALSASNLFDRQPPYVSNRTTFSAAGFDPDNASAIGRLVALELVKSW